MNTFISGWFGKLVLFSAFTDIGSFMFLHVSSSLLAEMKCTGLAVKVKYSAQLILISSTLPCQLLVSVLFGSEG